MSLDERKMQILQAIIDDYIMTATPVGSRTVSRHAGLGLSSATIRNEMLDLKELGLLEQPHTSAGSMPSDKAYRLYVDSMMSRARLTKDEQAAINHHFNTKIDGVEDVIKQTAVVLSRLTNYMSIVIAPSLCAAKLRRIQLVPVGESKALLVVVTDSEVLRDTIIRVPNGISSDDLDCVSKMLTASLCGYQLEEISSDKMFDVFSKLGERREYLTFLSDIQASVEQVAKPGETELELSGLNNLLSFPEYSDISAAKGMLTVAERHDMLCKLLTNATRAEFTFSIGSENDDENLKNSSVVTVTYKVGDTPIGSLGVIGPTRMNYSKVLAVMQHLSQSISELLTSLLDGDGKQ